MKVTAVIASFVFLAVAAQVQANCPGQNLLARPENPSVAGPWAVGARTFRNISKRDLTVEVWYPAAADSEAGVPNVVYNMREYLPRRYRNNLPEEKNPPQDCDCFRDLPIDAAHGPYPVVEFIHGTAGFRTQSLHLMTHLASRGFIVIAMDCPGIRLEDLLVNPVSGKTNQALDGNLVLDELMLLQTKERKSAFDFLDGFVDFDHVGATGHSAGGGAIAKLGDRADVLIPLSAGAGISGNRVKSALYFSGVDDGIAGFSGVQGAYRSLNNPNIRSKRLVGVANAGHLLPSDLCYIGRDQGGIVSIGIEAGIPGARLLASLGTDGCKPGQLPAEEGWISVNYAVAAAFEEVLMCDKSMTQKLANISARVPDVTVYDEKIASSRIFFNYSE